MPSIRHFAIAALCLGYENMSAFVPVGIDEIEKLMREPGLSDAAMRLPR